MLMFLLPIKKFTKVFMMPNGNKFGYQSAVWLVLCAPRTPFIGISGLKGDL